jgi:hypothetical protein
MRTNRKPYSSRLFLWHRQVRDFRLALVAIHTSSTSHPQPQPSAVFAIFQFHSHIALFALPTIAVHCSSKKWEILIDLPQTHRSQFKEKSPALIPRTLAETERRARFFCEGLLDYLIV